MTTAFDSVYDQFLMIVKDFRLEELYQTSEANFLTYLSGWLIPAITDFSPYCGQSLAYTGTTFDETLTEENIKILARMMRIYWLEQEIENITQMSLHVQDKDFKTFAEANNLNAKRETLNGDLEKISQIIVDLRMRDDTLWTNFLNGNFFTPA